MGNRKEEVTMSVSLSSYTTKPNFGTIRYSTKSLTFEQLCQDIQNGYCFCHQYDTENEEFGVKEKRLDNFKQTSFLWLDCDNATKSIDEAFETLEYKPNIAYTTFSNGIKGNRYRFIYLTNFDIHSNEEYKSYLNIILNSVLSDMGNGFYSCIDSSCFNVSQQMMGSNQNCTLLQNKDYYYSKETFSTMIETYGNKPIIKDKCPYSSISNNTNNKKRENTLNRNQVLSTLEKAALELYNNPNFKPELSNLDKVKYDTNDVYTNVEEQNIYVINRWFRAKKDYEENKPVRCPVGHRNRILFTCGIILKNITPDIKEEEVAASLWWIYQHRCEHTPSMTMREICNLALNSFSKDNPKLGKRKYVIGPKYENLSRQSKMLYLGMARQRTRDEHVMSEFDFNKTVKENAKDIGVCENTVYAALKNQGISLRDSKYLAFCEIFKKNPTASIRELAKICGLAKSTIERYKKRFEKEMSEIKQ